MKVKKKKKKEEQRTIENIQHIILHHQPPLHPFIFQVSRWTATLHHNARTRPPSVQLLETSLEQNKEIKFKKNKQTNKQRFWLREDRFFPSSSSASLFSLKLYFTRQHRSASLSADRVAFACSIRDTQRKQRRNVSTI